MRGAFEQRLVAPGHAKGVTDVVPHVICHQRLDVEICGDALRELLEFAAWHQVLELRLADQHDLQHFSLSAWRLESMRSSSSVLLPRF